MDVDWMDHDEYKEKKSGHYREVNDLPAVKEWNERQKQLKKLAAEARKEKKKATIKVAA